MKKSLSFFALALVSLLILSCNSKKNNDNWLEVKPQNGLTYSKHSLVGENNVEITKPEFKMNSNILFLLKGIKGFTLENEVAYIGCSMKVEDDETKEIVLNEDDLFSSYDSTGVSPKLIEEGVSNTLLVGKPMTVGKNYTWHSRVWDKKGKGEVLVKIEFRIVEPETK